MTTRLARQIQDLADFLDRSASPSRSEVSLRMAKMMSDADLLRRARLVTEADFHSAFVSTPMDKIQAIYDGPIFSGDRPEMRDLWGAFTYALAQIEDQSPEKDPEYSGWVSQIRMIMDGLGL